MDFTSRFGSPQTGCVQNVMSQRGSTICQGGRHRRHTQQPAPVFTCWWVAAVQLDVVMLENMTSLAPCSSSDGNTLHCVLPQIRDSRQANRC